MMLKETQLWGGGVHDVVCIAMVTSGMLVVVTGNFGNGIGRGS